LRWQTRSLITEVHPAATSGLGASESDVREAASLGLQAARSGVPFPMCLSLDIQSLTRPDPPRIPDSGRGGIALSANYDMWLGQLADRFRHRLGHPLPSAAAVWPILLGNAVLGRLKGNLVGRAEAYADLLSDPNAAALILKAWREKRVVKALDFAWLSPTETALAAKSSAGAFLSRAAAAVAHRPDLAGAVPERFEPRAAKIFAQAPRIPWPDTPDGPRWSEFPQRVDPTLRPPRLSYDALHPRTGKPRLATYVKPINQAIFEIINNIGLKLSDEAMSDPSRSLVVRLGWTVGRDGLAQAHALQALIAVLIDDWRELMERPDEHHPWLQLSFKVARLAAGQARQDDLGRPGPSWRRRLTEKGLSPPSSLVGSVFERVDAFRVLTGNTGFQGFPEDWNEPGGWRVGCVLRTDLEGGLGFRLVAGSQVDPSCWEGADERVATRFDHLIVVHSNPDTPRAWVCSVERRAKRSTLNAIDRGVGATDPLRLFHSGLRLAAARVLLREAQRLSVSVDSYEEGY
jgi:hypothetical protein